MLSAKKMMSGQRMPAYHALMLRRREGSRTDALMNLMAILNVRTSNANGIRSVTTSTVQCATELPKRSRLSSAFGIQRSIQFCAIAVCSIERLHEGTCASVSEEISQMG